jgi:hypothetical protein
MAAPKGVIYLVASAKGLYKLTLTLPLLIIRRDQALAFNGLFLAYKTTFALT